MRVWLDDVRPKPDDFDVHIKDIKSAKELVITGRVTFLSFDHDLGHMSDNYTGYDLAVFVEELAAEGLIPKFGWAVHSSNPVGAEKIRQAMRSADRFWRDYKSWTS